MIDELTRTATRAALADLAETQRKIDNPDTPAPDHKKAQEALPILLRAARVALELHADPDPPEPEAVDLLSDPATVVVAGVPSGRPRRVWFPARRRRAADHGGHDRRRACLDRAARHVEPDGPDRGASAMARPPGATPAPPARTAGGRLATSRGADRGRPAPAGHPAGAAARSTTRARRSTAAWPSVT